MSTNTPRRSRPNREVVLTSAEVDEVLAHGHVADPTWHPEATQFRPNGNTAIRLARSAR